MRRFTFVLDPPLQFHHDLSPRQRGKKRLRICRLNLKSGRNNREKQKQKERNLRCVYTARTLYESGAGTCGVAIFLWTREKGTESLENYDTQVHETKPRLGEAVKSRENFKRTRRVSFPQFDHKTKVYIHGEKQSHGGGFARRHSRNPCRYNLSRQTHRRTTKSASTGTCLHGCIYSTYCRSFFSASMQAHP